MVMLLVGIAINLALWRIRSINRLSEQCRQAQSTFKQVQIAPEDSIKPQSIQPRINRGMSL
ncbi:hypothetical protein CVP04_08150 [Caviibacterium pharyngocola]|uniref:Uncharacterized protein n=1 Tax=Caviibacterium pharyngocola TaxID=28159 RepID=A0A2M8RUS4_9PAST|nr:hypothetical protein CVP04_08150 [Caviibacterium pharyngocola]